MQSCATKQAEERRFLDDLRAAFPQRAVAALHEVGRRVGLDYFGLDCSVMPDGRLVVFEVETGMIVHERATAAALRDHQDPSLRIRRAVERLIDNRCGIVMN